MKTLFIILLIITSCNAFGSRNWQTGTIYKTSIRTNGTATIPFGNITVARPISRLFYYIETDDLKIEAVPSGRKPLNVTINKPTRISINGNKLYLIDDLGKENKLKITQKFAK